jgi:hypothetical protein
MYKYRTTVLLAQVIQAIRRTRVGHYIQIMEVDVKVVVLGADFKIQTGARHDTRNTSLVQEQCTTCT